jgi:surfeit locus 1 family protein
LSLARRLAVPALSTAVMLAVLVVLGSWQVRRLHWKQGLLAEIDAAEQAPAVPLPAAPLPFAKVSVSGHLRADLVAHYAAEVRDLPGGAMLGTQLLVPLERAGAPPVLVDLGWVPGQGWLPTLPAGEVSLAGFVRTPEHPAWFSARDDAVARQFYTLDPQAIGAALGLARVAPFTLVVLAPGTPGQYPDPARTLPRPPNNHLQYALTWYSLAAVLVVIFAIYVRKVPRA